jgi:hypothetical protein
MADVIKLRTLASDHAGYTLLGGVFFATLNLLGFGYSFDNSFNIRL